MRCRNICSLPRAARPAPSSAFGARHRLHSAHILEISDHLPIKIEFIESREKVDLVLPELEKRTGSGLIEIQETTIVVPARP